MLDLQHCYGGADNVVSAELYSPGPDSLAGGRVTKAWGPNRHVYFNLQVSKTPTRIVYYRDNQEIPTGAPLTGKNLKCVLHFETQANETILVKTGISAVSADSAANNVKQEIPGWDFDAVRQGLQCILVAVW